MKKFYYKIIFLTLIYFSGCKDSTTDPEENKPDDTLPGYDLVWSDEFNSGNLDLTKWNYETGTGVSGDWGTGQLDRATNRKENVNVVNGIADADGGCLAITTRKELYIDREYTSGRLTTSGKAAFGPGYRITARVYPKDVRYKGQGFAFWMMPAEKPAGYNSIMWPQGGEIDIMEYVAAIPFHNLGSVHYAWSWENNEYRDWNHGHLGGYFNYAQQQVPLQNPSYGNYPVKETEVNAGSYSFHTYGIEWYNDRLEFFIDDVVYHIHYFNDGGAFSPADGQDKKQVKSINNKTTLVSEYSNHFNEWHPFEHNFFMILSAGVGGNDNKTYGGAITPDAVFPCSVYIDWVRVYKRK